jgi:pimeloyl-ACP methyl ester carboxylesterase
VPELRVDRDGVCLAATYSQAGPAAVVALHGASAGTRDFYLYRHLHTLLPALGIGVVTFDRRGEGESTGQPSRGRFQVQAADALAVLEALDAEQVGLWGISQGAWVGPLAAMLSARVAFLVLIASTGVTPAEQMRYAVAQQLRRAGYRDEIVDRVTALRLATEDWLRGDLIAVELQSLLETSSREPWWDLAYLPQALPDEESRRDLAKEMFFEPEPVFRHVSVPTLLFYGDDDVWTPVPESIEVWRGARGDDVDIIVLPGTGHEPTMADGTISLLYVNKLTEWLTERYGRRRH